MPTQFYCYDSPKQLIKKKNFLSNKIRPFIKSTCKLSKFEYIQSTTRRMELDRIERECYIEKHKYDKFYYYMCELVRFIVIYVFIFCIYFLMTMLIKKLSV